MTDPMPDARLAEIEARANAATGGPWFAWDRGVGWHIALEDGPRPWRFLPEGMRTDLGRGEDAAFIAAARTDVPDLIAEVRRLRALVSECPNPRDTP